MFNNKLGSPMFAVIFKAEMKTGVSSNKTYLDLAKQLRDIAISEYGCTQFTAVTEGDYEIAISYWPSEQAIVDWKRDSRHLHAQQVGQEQWYKTYEVEVLQVLRSYKK